MQGIRSVMEDGDLPPMDGAYTIPDDLRKAGHPKPALGQAFQTIANYREEQDRIAADLLEREIWVVTVILALSAPVWNQLATPTLEFRLDQPSEPVPYHIELGCFSHLAALAAPRAEERALIESTTPCWAQVYPHYEREQAGQTGALARSYVPISVAEAVTLLGLERILSQLEAATSRIGQSLALRARAQAARQERLLEVERALGWTREPSAAPKERQPAAITRRAALLLQPGSRGRLAIGSAFMGFVVALICALIGLSQALIGLMVVVVCLLAWQRLLR
ncbi:MAG TPA: hypothetical protein VN837_04775 [Chloroflexota bacterium]|nr:hypothetical protein [Chloroflexota bacterium]